MSWIQHNNHHHYGIIQRDGYMTTYPPPLFPPSADSVHKTSSSSTRISPLVLIVIVVLAVLFFISGLLHLLFRLLIKQKQQQQQHHHPSSSHESDRYPSDALQRQLQQLFHLHDSSAGGLDQSFIDALPVFYYKELKGPKEQLFDCAVCLSELNDNDKLRLLPMCTHAFHINCIDTWLLSNSTCPLCRGTLFSAGFSIENPMFDFDDFQEEDGVVPVSRGTGLTSIQKTTEIEEIVVEKGTFPVRLGKFRRLNDGEGHENGEETSSSNNLDARRCYSMGSYQYVLGESTLRVASTCDQLVRNEKLATGMERDVNSCSTDGNAPGKKTSSVAKGESYSVSKIWLWSRKGKFSSSSDSHEDMLLSSLAVELPWTGKQQGISGVST